MGVPVGTEVGSGVEVTVGTCVSIGRGVASGWGGVLTHAARPSDKRISQNHFDIFTAPPAHQIGIFESFRVDLRLF